MGELKLGLLPRETNKTFVGVIVRRQKIILFFTVIGRNRRLTFLVKESIGFESDFSRFIFGRGLGENAS